MKQSYTARKIMKNKKIKCDIYTRVSTNMQVDGRFLKHIKFCFPVYFGDRETQKFCWEKESTVESTFSLSKRCYGMSSITTKLEETQLTSIALSVFVTNLFRIQRRILYALLHLFRFWHDWNRCKSWKLRISA